MDNGPMAKCIPYIQGYQQHALSEEHIEEGSVVLVGQLNASV